MSDKWDWAIYRQELRREWREQRRDIAVSFGVLALVLLVVWLTR